MSRRHATQRETVERLVRQHGIMRHSDLRGAGINPATLARLVKEGVLHQPTRGLYELANAEIEIAHSLAEVSKRVPRGIVCLLSALQFHEITLQLPRRVWICIGSTDREPRPAYPPLRVVRFSDMARTLGVERHVIDRVPVRIFDPAKSIVDCFRFRNKVGLDVAMEALRMGWRSRKASADDIVDYARRLRIWSVVQPYLQSVVADEG